jgi:hypothetical protein
MRQEDGKLTDPKEQFRAVEYFMRSYSKNSPDIMETEDSLPRSQQPANDP